MLHIENGIPNVQGMEFYDGKSGGDPLGVHEAIMDRNIGPEQKRNLTTPKK
jgi:hypothetical protein